ncbi:MAG: type I methionyl aminopeptidase [Verrucomicrobia bacterium]|nr:type I methionyl aminopeptidase [Verrucomicrobiota bacterium]MCG2678994.1 type I methionyl aminopeptidase [Kiritimatiellia bacterium]MBU4248346.1 type I methionyl aminopeptidase [Verrucomicrobiota bacterium]MBU4289731.1 type I methionyl aminopeptidase [Verrucomicrobiota bacterium]MBU4428555.1 type I methionyl aminopeptidase [Verrucomicrobiota bacterium]
MIIIKNHEELKKMRRAGRITAEVCDAVARSVGPGMTTAEIDRCAANMIRQFGAKSAFLGYRGYPGNVCISVNEEVVHGLPGPRRIRIGDIVSLDVGVVVDGFVGDMATTIMVGVSDPDVIRLVATAQQALAAGIRQARAGNRLSDISAAIEQVATAAGFSVVHDFVGHGIGRTMHEDPQIPNFGSPGRGPVLRDGMTLAIEPMVNLGVAGVEVLEDRWTVVTRDRRPSAHVEHTVAVGVTAAEILTCASEKRDN